MSFVSNTRLEQFQTKHELARNFYDDHEFCPLYDIEEATEHRERIQKRTSPYPSPNHSPSHYYFSTKKHSNMTSSEQQYWIPYNNRHINYTTPSRKIPIIHPVTKQVLQQSSRYQYLVSAR